jgi:hypothetical protein
LEPGRATIPAAAAVGYRHLMGEDAAGNLSALEATRNNLVDPKIAERDGSMVPSRSPLGRSGLPRNRRFGAEPREGEIACPGTAAERPNRS